MQYTYIRLAYDLTCIYNVYVILILNYTCINICSIYNQISMLTEWVNNIY